MGNFIDFLNSLDPDFSEKESERYKKSKKVRFNIGGQSGFKWKTESANKTWLENGKIIKEKKGKKIPK